ncbi:MAG: endonuclease [Planctomycetia bacterium]|nr:endonuclease [Planctomycetia bacterium]
MGAALGWSWLAGPARATAAESGLHRREGYTAVAALASPHATQAAAAGEHVIYAISSTAVARYDRRSGRLIDVADGAGARHLNSGFLLGGRLFLAHSNYPHTPPESDIRALDPAGDHLEVFHRFVDPPGSLVWCIVNDGVWWCCFARYGRDNRRTVLIEYADGGLEREVRRFRFPAVVVDDWDDMSASGGIWAGDTLLVSHHHHRVLYRLALPTTGDELRLVETLTCPFPGQGIAADASSGGLVGIDREHLRVLFAVPTRNGSSPH